MPIVGTAVREANRRCTLRSRGLRPELYDFVPSGLFGLSEPRSKKVLGKWLSKSCINEKRSSHGSPRNRFQPRVPIKRERVRKSATCGHESIVRPQSSETVTVFSSV